MEEVGCFFSWMINKNNNRIRIDSNWGSRLISSSIFSFCISRWFFHRMHIAHVTIEIINLQSLGWNCCCYSKLILETCSIPICLRYNNFYTKIYQTKEGQVESFSFFLLEARNFEIFQFANRIRHQNVRIKKVLNVFTFCWLCQSAESRDSIRLFWYPLAEQIKNWNQITKKKNNNKDLWAP